MQSVAKKCDKQFTDNKHIQYLKLKCRFLDQKSRNLCKEDIIVSGPVDISFGSESADRYISFTDPGLDPT
jgi:hypothetical protein